MPMKASVNQETCIGCQLCTAICPSVFYMQESGKATTVEGNHSDPSTEEACAMCPVNAISIDNNE